MSIFNTAVCFSLCTLRIQEEEIMLIYKDDLVRFILKKFKNTFIIFLAKSQEPFA